MHDTLNVEQIAKTLNHSVNDIEHYQVQIREKLPIIKLDEVLTLLQWHGPNTAEDAIGGLKEGE